MTEILSSQLSQYIDSLIPERPAELQAMEAWAKQHEFPIIGPACGYLCYQVARMIGAKRIFELGSGYGYSTAFFARALKENGGGVVHHVVWDEELSNRARKHLTALGFHDEVQYHNGEAVETLRNSTDGPFDLIFNDIDKHGYPAALPVIEERLRPGGVLDHRQHDLAQPDFRCERSDAGHAGCPRGHEGVDDEPELDRVARADPRRDDRRGPEVARATRRDVRSPARTPADRPRRIPLPRHRACCSGPTRRAPR